MNELWLDTQYIGQSLAGQLSSCRKGTGVEDYAEGCDCSKHVVLSNGRL